MLELHFIMKDYTIKTYKNIGNRIIKLINGFYYFDSNIYTIRIAQNDVDRYMFIETGKEKYIKNNWYKVYDNMFEELNIFKVIDFKRELVYYKDLNGNVNYLIPGSSFDSRTFKLPQDEYFKVKE